MSDLLLEVIALDARDAHAAQEGGADRLELVSDMAADGLTPAVATARRVLAATDLPVRAMLRDSAGFAPWSLDQLRAEAVALRDVGVTEFVLGWLTEDGVVDVDACRTVIAELDGCKFTFHRALDHSADLLAAWKEVATLGADTVLAAGSGAGVADGLPMLRKLATLQEADGLTVMAGGGLRVDQVPGLRADGVRRFHVGSAVRPQGWNHPVDAAAVAEWATLVRG
ncbi:copper homeostasis protein CutC [Kutzneria sp. CA-103260]|uniref:copper homeostasis protein CutC n=1 Tax=Kutzneria sp. CA-103260 TaxID=2802641 RepID=UPI001BA89ABA|nr:copper homeostasis protein CutC [Kutzneria sp. CA-103260]QUQ69524.1 copper homeostasis protein [Kutzneria sp. CA-103260]